MTDPVPPLEGAAGPNGGHFAADHGPLPNPVGHTFPLVSHDADANWRLIGTGFYISYDGLFVTARHVVEDVLRDGHQVQPLAIFHLLSSSGLFGPQEYLVRPVAQCWIGERADIALGVARTMPNNRTGQTLITPWRWPLLWTPPPIGTAVGTNAFPNHVIERAADRQLIRWHPDFYFGVIQGAGDYRDNVMVPYPYFYADYRIHGGSSGGPVFLQGSGVYGVNCTELKPHGPGFGAQVRCLQDAFIEENLSSDEQAPRRVTFAELVSGGVLTVTGFTPGSIAPQPGRLVRFDTILPTARGPDMEFVVYT
jgi:hypothetical protein